MVYVLVDEHGSVVFVAVLCDFIDRPIAQMTLVIRLALFAGLGYCLFSWFWTKKVPAERANAFRRGVLLHVACWSVVLLLL